MKSVIIISSRQPSLKRLSEAYGDIGTTNLSSPKRLVVEGAWGWFAITFDRELEGEFSDEERTKIGQLIAQPVYYAQLEYSSASAVNLAIERMPTNAETLIDNDHGMLRLIDEVRNLIRAGMEWQTTSV